MLSLARDLGGLATVPADGTASAIDLADIEIVRELGGLEAEWRSFEKNAAGHVFQSYDFVVPWMASVGAARKVSPLIVLGRARDGSLLFLLPLGVRLCARTRLLEWLGGEHADYHGGLYAPRYLARLSAETAAALPAKVVALFKPEADTVHFQRQPAEIGGHANPFAAYRATPYSAKCHQTQLGDDWDRYYRSKRNSSSRRHDRHKWQRLETLGPVRVIDAVEPAEIRRALAALFAQKERSLADRGVPPFFKSQTVKDFYETVALDPYPHGLCHVSAIEVAGEIVAANWGLVRDKHYYYVMTSYAGGPAAASSPGRALMYHLMEWCIDRGIETFDFTIGDEDFKTHWCERSSPLYDSVAVLNPRGIGLAATLRGLKAIKRVVKGNPRLRSFADQVRRRMTATGR
jgi:CelD/BcsL family acetyltransferase involved in cellulose biosynthesis